MKIQRSLAFLLVVLSLGLFAQRAYADAFVNKTAGLSLEFPKGWQVQPQGDQVVVAADPKDEAAVLMVTVEATDTKKVGDAMDAQLAKTMKDVKWGPQEKVTVAGSSAVALKGSATMDGKPLKLGVVILTTAKKKGVFLLGFVMADKEKAHKAELDGVIASVKAVK